MRSSFAYLILALLVLGGCDAMPSYHEARMQVVSLSTGNIDFGAPPFKVAEVGSGIQVGIDKQFLESEEVIERALLNCDLPTSTVDSLLPFYVSEMKVETFEAGIIQITVKDTDADRALLFLNKLVVSHTDVKYEASSQRVGKFLQKLKASHEEVSTRAQEFEAKMTELLHSVGTDNEEYLDVLEEYEDAKDEIHSLQIEIRELESEANLKVPTLLIVIEPYLVR